MHFNSFLKGSIKKQFGCRDIQASRQESCAPTTLSFFEKMRLDRVKNLADRSLGKSYVLGRGGFFGRTKRVSPTCLVYLERNRYGVPASFANRPVSVWLYPERIVVAAEGQAIYEHRRVFVRSHSQQGQLIYDWRYLFGGHPT